MAVSPLKGCTKRIVANECYGACYSNYLTKYGCVTKAETSDTADVDHIDKRDVLCAKEAIHTKIQVRNFPDPFDGLVMLKVKSMPPLACN